jgi:hypothetical protein
METQQMTMPTLTGQATKVLNDKSVKNIFASTKSMKLIISILSVSLFFFSCSRKTKHQNKNADLSDATAEYIEISREKYASQLYGFWLGQCIANWTGLVTEMDKIGDIGDIKTGDFYTREDWEKLTSQASGDRVFPATSRPLSILYSEIPMKSGELTMIPISNTCISIFYISIRPVNYRRNKSEMVGLST